MTELEWIDAIRIALSPNGSDPNSRTGASLYDELSLAIKASSKKGEVRPFLNALVHVANENRQNSSARWWASLINLLHHYRNDLGGDGRLLLKGTFEIEWPELPLSCRALMLRQISPYINLNWRRIGAQRNYRDLIEAFPLYIADAMASSGDIGTAEDITERAIERGKVSKEDANDMRSRWKRGAAPNSEQVSANSVDLHLSNPDFVERLQMVLQNTLVVAKYEKIPASI